MKLLLLSNSANKGEDFLEYPRNEIIAFLGKGPLNVLFIPFATVTLGYNEYEMLIADRLNKMGNYLVTSIHRKENYSKAIDECDVIMVGGGNTFMLLHQLQIHGLTGKLRDKIYRGAPYIGWSAGANLACPTISTTNDMPVVWPKSLNALNLVPFQVNPHFTEFVPENFVGESREMRLREFVEVNNGIYIVALREGTLLCIENENIRYSGKKKARIYHSNNEARDVIEGDDINFLMK